MTQRGLVLDKNIQLFFSTRNIPLVYWRKADQNVRHRPILTCENYSKWYSLWLVNPDGTVQEVVKELLDYAGNDTVWSDHVPNPAVVCRLAWAKGWYMDDEALEMIIGRWEMEYKGNYQE